MILPKKNFKLKVGPFHFDVEYSKKHCDDSRALGLCIKDELKIYIDPERPQAIIEQTFFHEMTHAAFYVADLDLSLGVKDKKLNEEELVSRVSMTMFQVVKENPKIFR